MLGIHDRDAADVDPVLLRDRLDARPRPYENRRDETDFGRIDDPTQRALVAWMGTAVGVGGSVLQMSSRCWYFSCLRSIGPPDYARTR
jgi:hypothetical protein